MRAAVPASTLDPLTSLQGRDVTVSISACDADCTGANPVALTIYFIGLRPVAP